MITPRQHRLLQFITGYIETHGYSPLYREMADEMGLRAKSAVWQLVTRLEERGYIRRVPYSPRDVEVLRAPSIPRSPEGVPLFYVEQKEVI